MVALVPQHRVALDPTVVIHQVPRPGRVVAEGTEVKLVLGMLARETWFRRTTC